MCSKIIFVSLRLFAALLFLATAQNLSAVSLESPDRQIRAEFFLNAAGELEYTLALDRRTVVFPSRIGISVEGQDLGTDLKLGVAEYSSIDESYPRLGVKVRAYNRANTLRLSLLQRSNRQPLQLEARAYNDGFAWRLIVPGDGMRRIDGEASTWTLPEDCVVWFAERNSDWKLKTYAGEWISARIEALPTISKQGPVQGPPILIELPSQGGYALLTEAALANYSGLRLRATGDRRLQADFTEGKTGFTVQGSITTPWRVTMLSRDLDGLVNSDLIGNLNPAPDPVLFADTRYIKAGRSVWRWWSVGTGAPAEERQFVDYAAELGFEFTMVDEGWAKWPNAWGEIRALTGHARSRGVAVVIWADVKDLRSPEGNWHRLREFLDHAREAGVAAVKLDFINSESRESVDFQLTALRLAAERRLMVIFHGVQKPTGETRTYPNEITREGIRGLELNKIMTETAIPAAHNVVLPFTRLVVGQGDYTPLGYSRPGDTTWAHQLGTVVQFTSPLQVIAEHPEMMLREPATLSTLDVLKAIPAAWDETRVLAPSRIGKVSIIARRSGSDWFLSILTGNEPIKISALDLSFLTDRHYHLIRIGSPTAHSFSRQEFVDVNRRTELSVDLMAADGLVCWFRAIEPRIPSDSPVAAKSNGTSRSSLSACCRTSTGETASCSSSARCSGSLAGSDRIGGAHLSP